MHLTKFRYEIGVLNEDALPYKAISDELAKYVGPKNTHQTSDQRMQFYLPSQREIVRLIRARNNGATLESVVISRHNNTPTGFTNNLMRRHGGRLVEVSSAEKNVDCVHDFLFRADFKTVDSS